jgi:hypothetical protein
MACNLYFSSNDFEDEQRHTCNTESSNTLHRAQQIEKWRWTRPVYCFKKKEEKQDDDERGKVNERIK